MCAAPISKGQPSPYDGQVLTTDLAVSLGQKADSCDARAKLEVAYAIKLERVDIERLQKLLAIDKETNGLRNQMLMNQLAREQAWWRQPAFVIPVTASVVLGVVMATGYALQGVGG